MDKKILFKKIKTNLMDPFKQIERILIWLSPFIKSDVIYLKMMYFARTQKILHLKKPRTFGDKQQWLKIYYRKSVMTTMVDKFAVKKYVANIIGDQYVIPTLGVWDKPDEIDWASLPNQFVIKTTHGGGGEDVIICKDKDRINRNDIIQKLYKSMKHDIYKYYREWPYKNVVPRIIVEKYMNEDEAGSIEGGEKDGLIDYKFFCFNGKPSYCQVIRGRHTKMTIDFYDMEWNHQPFHEPKKYPFSQKSIASPKCLIKMIELSRKLSDGFPFLRVDFYEINMKVYFGELTFFPTSGMGKFDPDKWNLIFGKMIVLPNEQIQ